MVEKTNRREGEIMRCISLREAKNNKLIQLTIWLDLDKENRKFLTKEYKRINDDPDRICRIVKHKNKFALFVDDYASRVNSIEAANENK